MVTNKSFSIGIAGDSGSGKTMLVSTIKKVLGEENISLLDGDGDHKWERGDSHWLKYTHLNPNANNLNKQADDLEKLKSGASILRSEYDHETGKFTEEKEVLPKPYIILCGLHSLYLPETRKNLDLMIYMDIDESLRRSWKIQRDVHERGHSEDKVLNEMRKRLPDAGKYVYPQREYSDISIRYFCEPEDKTHDNLFFQVASYVKFDMEKVQRCLASYNAEIDHYRDEYYGRNIVAVYGSRMESRSINLGDILRLLGINNINYNNIGIDLFHGIMLMFIMTTINTMIGNSNE